MRKFYNIKPYSKNSDYDTVVKEVQSIYNELLKITFKQGKLDLGAIKFLSSLETKLRRYEKRPSNAQFKLIMKFLKKGYRSRFIKLTKNRNLIISGIEAALEIFDGKEFWMDLDEEHAIDSLGMVNMYLGDTLNHLNLAYAIHKMNKRKIDECLSMDTSSREQIPYDVWEFCQELLER